MHSNFPIHLCFCIWCWLVIVSTRYTLVAAVYFKLMVVVVVVCFSCANAIGILYL